jgi:predicted RNase H-like HicB family nuclease
MTLNVIIEKMSSNWCAYTPDDDLGVIAVAGQTREEAVSNFRSALKDHLEVMRERGTEPPVVENLNVQELMPV